MVSGLCFTGNEKKGTQARKEFVLTLLVQFGDLRVASHLTCTGWTPQECSVDVTAGTERMATMCHFYPVFSMLSLLRLVKQARSDLHVTPDATEKPCPEPLFQ